MNACPRCSKDDRVRDVTPEACYMCDRPWDPEKRTYDCARCNVTWVEKPGDDANRRRTMTRSSK